MGDVSRRQFLGTAAGLGLGAGFGLGCGQREGAPAAVESGAASVPARPNIVLIILDTVRADKMSCHGYPHPTTPALDRLASKGVLFDRVIAQCSWTRPSCGSLLTSLYPRQLGLYREKSEIIADHFDTLSVILQKAGYKTFGITANPNLNTIFNFQRGFDTYIDTNVVWSWMERQENQTVRGGKSLPTANEMFSQIKEWARQCDPAAPKYVQVNAMEVHEWYVRNTMIRPEYRREFLDSGEKYPKYLQSLRQLSDDTAKFVEELSVLPGWENTLFAMIGDHGEGLEEHRGVANSLYHGWLLYEAEVVVPMIFYNKAWQPRVSKVQQPVRLLELAPTLLDYAGVPPLSNMQGVSLRPLLDGAVEKADLPAYFVCETNWRETDKVGIYVPDWKLFDNKMPHKGLPPRELQKRGSREAGVLTDQAAAQPELAAQLAAFLSEWEAKFPKAAPTTAGRELTEEEKEQMRAIGYIPD